MLSDPKDKEWIPVLHLKENSNSAFFRDNQKMF